VGAALGATGLGAFVNDVSMVHGIPARAVVAYVEASAEGCDWRDLAAIGWREAGHGTYSGDGVERHLDEATGVLTPALDKWDVIDMGGGPMGFLRGTWEGGGYAEAFPGEGDGGYQDMDAAARAACRYLKATGYDPSDPGARWEGFRRYNGAGAYADAALEYADSLPALPAELAGQQVALTTSQAEELGGTRRRSLGDTVEAGWQGLWEWVDHRQAERIDTPTLEAVQGFLAPMADASELPQGATTADLEGGGDAVVDMGGFQVASAIAADTKAMVAAAREDGVDLRPMGPRSAWRSYEDQVGLRQQNGCPDIYDADPMQCEVPTARPGHSNHEAGLAVDWHPDGWGWLESNAHRFGFTAGVPGEPWHYSRGGG
jgi:LAS superfamily LD-carboxypeptidase LdcB